MSKTLWQYTSVSEREKRMRCSKQSDKMFSVKSQGHQYPNILLHTLISDSCSPWDRWITPVSYVTLNLIDQTLRQKGIQTETLVSDNLPLPFYAKICILFSLDQHFLSHLNFNYWWMHPEYHWLILAKEADWWIVWSGKFSTHRSAVSINQLWTNYLQNVSWSLWTCLKSQNDGATSYLCTQAQWHDGVLKGRVSVHVWRNTWKYYKHTCRVRVVRPVECK